MIDLVPWPDRFYVEPPKLDAYLLDPASDDGVSKGRYSKSRYLLSYGFDAARPAELRDALIAHATAASFVGRRVTSFGLKFNFDGPCPPPTVARRPS
ncbi:hypothetical protein Q8W71_23280 [Methylobacterium sp. NEAU 140]|uniref:hypothetical protein n=1 Tax=Methylobacterium sp. NEAU 140 TaxID=3064945 RepID=UPI002735D482|nr:hypothetical protein [Methylobacterium sp. NEAU 140]MDP4025562.1 hypothetical protein [Methylobacterium sp. NEAU 140]